VKPLAIAILVALLTDQSRTPRAAPRALCVAPHFVDTPPASAGNLPFCSGGRYTLMVDDRPAVEWPRTQSLKIDGLDAKARHRVVVRCDEKPHQSFRFRFSDFKSLEPCLFLNDLYKTAQLWESRRAPWCSCR
jgi:hypothetical protein